MSGPRSKLKVKTAIPMARIKKIMQSDEDVGKVSKHSPVLISKSLELFLHDLLSKCATITQEKNGKSITPTHVKQCVMATPAFDFLLDIVKDIPDIEPDKPRRTRKPREPKQGAGKNAEAAEAEEAEDDEDEDDAEEEGDE